MLCNGNENAVDRMENGLKNGMKTYRSTPSKLIAWLIMLILLYVINLNNDLLYHTLAEIFSVIIAYIVFFITWKSKGLISNRYLIFLGIAYFFIGSYDLLHTILFRGMGAFPVLDPNPSIQFYLISRYLESASFLIAPLFLILNKDNEINDSMHLRNSQFAWRIFLIYTMITACFLVSVIYFKNFPTCYIEGSGDTPFFEISEYLVSFMLICSLVLLYKSRKKFEIKVFEALSLSIIFTLLGEMPYLTYSPMNEFPSFVGHFFKMVSFYFLYVAFVEAGLEQPFNILIRKTEQEDVFKEEATFLASEQNYVYRLLGVDQNIRQEMIVKNSKMGEEDYSSFIQNFSGILFQLDNKFIPKLMAGSIKEITGYNKEDFLSGKMNWTDITIPEHASIVDKYIGNIEPQLESTIEAEYRIRRKDGEIRWVKEYFKQISNNNVKYQGSIHDITNRKKLEETLKSREEARIKEIHHRIKNNLQVISSLLDLQAEEFNEKKAFQGEEILNAFKDSQNRVISMALIHEELYNSKDMITLDFSSYLQKLVEDLFISYTVKDQVNLKLNLEHVYLEMDTAIPLGIIVNELISNALKYAFEPRQKGDISISLYRKENREDVHETSLGSIEDRIFSDKYYQYALVVADNGVGIPKEIDFENTESLGLQLVGILSDQIEGHVELKRDAGTEFRIYFNSK